MINKQLLHPKSIAIIGASNNVAKPGGKIIKNLIDSGFKGELYAVNPNETQVQGIPCFTSVEELPPVDLAVLAIPAKFCYSAVKVLAEQNDTKAFIIISAGFGETNAEGKKLEQKIAGFNYTAQRLFNRTKLHWCNDTEPRKRIYNTYSGIDSRRM